LRSEPVMFKAGSWSFSFSLNITSTKFIYGTRSEAFSMLTRVGGFYKLYFPVPI
jgi:hypothetical protein